MDQNGSKWTKMDQNEQKWTKMDQIGSNWNKNGTKSSTKNLRNPQKSQKWHPRKSKKGPYKALKTDIWFTTRLDQFTDLPLDFIYEVGPSTLEIEAKAMPSSSSCYRLQHGWVPSLSDWTFSLVFTSIGSSSIHHAYFGITNIRWKFNPILRLKRRSLVEKWNKWALFTIPCAKNPLFWISSELYGWRKIIFTRSCNLSGVENNRDFSDTDPVYYFTSL